MEKNLNERQIVKLYLDDVRNPKTKGWTVVRNYEEFVNHISEYGLPEEVSFDHDLAEIHYDPETWRQDFVYHEKTGYDCVKWLVNYFYTMYPERLEMPYTERKRSDIMFPKVVVHSANPIGSANMMGYINNFYKNEGKPQSCVRVEIKHTIHHEAGN